MCCVVYIVGKLYQSGELGVCVCVGECVCVHTCMTYDMDIHVHVHTCTCTYIYIHTCRHICNYMCVCVPCIYP